jgi:hypothetical protein
MTVKAIPIAPVILFASALALAYSPAAMAVTPPSLSGAYNLSLIEDCQATFSYSTDPNSQDVSTLNSVSNGGIGATVVAATFSAGGKLAVTGWVDQGDLFIISGIGKSHVMKDSSFKATTSFSNNATSFTLGSITLHATYGNIDNGNIAHYMAFIGLDSTSTGCYVHGTAVKP